MVERGPSSTMKGRPPQPSHGGLPQKCLLSTLPPSSVPRRAARRARYAPEEGGARAPRGRGAHHPRHERPRSTARAERPPELPDYKMGFEEHIEVTDKPPAPTVSRPSSCKLFDEFSQKSTDSVGEEESESALVSRSRAARSPSAGTRTPGTTRPRPRTIRTSTATWPSGGRGHGPAPRAPAREVDVGDEWDVDRSSTSPSCGRAPVGLPRQGRRRATTSASSRQTSTWRARAPRARGGAQGGRVHVAVLHRS